MEENPRLVLFAFQLPTVKTQQDKVNEVMMTDLSAVVQRVSAEHRSSAGSSAG